MPNPLSVTQVDARLRGVIVPLVTNFDSSGDELDVTAFVRNIEAHLADGMSGVLVAGSTGEAALLDDDERAALIEAARAVVPSDRLLLAGVGSESTRQTVRRARQAAERGADAVLVVAPHYYTAAMDRAALLQHFTRVADESPLPVLLYNIPKYVHFALQPELVAELAQHRNVVGIKDSSGDLELLSGYIAVQREARLFSVLTGNGPTFAPALSRGAVGGILAVALFTGDAAPQILAAADSGDTARATELNDRLAPAGKEIVGAMGVPGVKAAMAYVRLAGGSVRSPLRSLDSDRLRRVGELVDATREEASSATG